MQFLKTAQESIWGKTFYEKVRGEGFSQAVKYFLLLLVSVALLTSFVTAGVFVATWQSLPKLSEMQQMTTDLYPDELVLTWKNGEMSSNVTEPYAIALPKEWRSHDEQNRNAPLAKNLLVINTSKSVETSDFERYDTLVILGKDSVGYENTPRGKVEIQHFSQDIDDFVLNKAKASEFVGIAFKFLKWALLFVFLFLPIILFIGLGIKYVVYLVFGALVIWIIAKLKKIDLTYGMAYKLGLYLLTLPLLVNILSYFLPILNAPFVFTLILAVIAYINLEQADKPESPIIATSPTSGGDTATPAVVSEPQPGKPEVSTPTTPPAV